VYPAVIRCFFLHFRHSKGGEFLQLSYKSIPHDMPNFGEHVIVELFYTICRIAVDSGYVSGEVLASHAELGIELVGPLKQEGGWQHETGYGLSTFQVDWQKQQVRCPQGHLSQNWCPGRHNRGEEVIRVSFSAVTCRACPVKELCTKREKNKGRILTLSPQSISEARSRRRTEQYTPPFQERYALRAGIEGTISEGLHSHGLRRARYRGQSKTQLQAKAIAAAINLVRIHQMLQRTSLGLSPRLKRPQSPFALLRPLLAA
jgi:transposase